MIALRIGILRWQADRRRRRAMALIDRTIIQAERLRSEAEALDLEASRLEVRRRREIEQGRRP